MTMGCNFDQSHFPNLLKAMDLLTSLLAPIPASKWRGRMCGSNREESTIETL